MSPTVSVLIPAHNAESTVEAAVRSIQRQTLDDIEVVIVDDGSTDATPDILESLARRDARLRVIHTPRGGIINALNRGITECRADLIARMDADDISHPKRIEEQVALMRADQSISVCSCLVRLFPRRDVTGGMARYKEWLNSTRTPEEIARDMFVESPVAHPSVMLRRHELVEIGGYQEHGWAEDYDLWLRYHVAGKRFAKVPRALVFWRQGEGRLTLTDGRYSVENFLRAKAHYLSTILLPAKRPVILWGAGKTGRRIAKHLIREGIRLDAVIDIEAKKIGHELRGAPIFSPDHLRGNREAFVISAVSSHGARELIREQLRALAFVESRDFICAA